MNPDHVHPSLSALLAALLHNEFTDSRCVSFTLGCLHDSTDQGACCLNLSVTDLGDHVRVRGHRFVHGCLESAVVGHNFETTSHHDLAR